MNKCPGCGTEFEGGYCPNCGAKWEEEKTCPSCGAKLNGAVRFCNECGYSFVAAKEPKPISKARNKVSNETVGKVYGLLKYVPAILSGLFAVLLFVFYAAPVAVLPSQDILGVSTPAESYGNVYSMNSGILGAVADLQGSMIALIIFAVFASVFAVVNIAVNLSSGTKNKKIALFGKIDMTLVGLFALISFAVYLIFFIIGCVSCGIIASTDGGMGILAPGACPVLLIVFSIVFALLGIGSLVARSMLIKNNPEIRKAESAREEAERKRKEEFYATHTKPEAPVVTAQNYITYKRRACVYKHELKRYNKAIEGKPSSAVIWWDMNKAPIIIVTLIAATVITVTCILVSIFTNKFRTGAVEQIELGFTQEQVREILGDPYEGSMTDSRWQYYDGDYMNALESLATNAEEQKQALTAGDENKLMSLLTEERNLKTKLESMTYKYIEVNFTKKSVEKNGDGDGESNSDVYVVSSVYFDPVVSNKATTIEKKEVERVEASVVGYCTDYSDWAKKIYVGCKDITDTVYSSYYKDGAFYRARFTNGTVQREDENIIVKWSDRFGSHEVKESLERSIEKSGIEVATIGDSNGNYYAGWWRTSNKDELCKLTSITIPNGVTSIGESAFSGCGSLTSIEIPDKESISDLHPTNSY